MMTFFTYQYCFIIVMQSWLDIPAYLVRLRPILYNCLCRSVKTQLLCFLLLTMAKEKLFVAQIFETDCSHNSLTILGS